MFSNRESAQGRSLETSVYERALGSDFAELHPQLRAYFGAIPAGFEGVGMGTFHEAGLRVWMLKPLFALLGRRHIAFAERGAQVPFAVRNSARGDAVHAVRTFHFSRASRTMTDVISVIDGRLIDRLGTKGEVEVELALQVRGGRLHMSSRRLVLRVFGLRLPLPHVITVALEESARADRSQHVDLRISMPVLGEVYGYRGTFTYALRRVALQ